MQIDKNIPIPAKNSGRPRTSKYPIHEMELGDSFAVEWTNQKSCGTLSSLNRQVAPKFLVQRSVIEDGKRMLRFWRVK